MSFYLICFLVVFHLAFKYVRNTHAAYKYVDLDAALLLIRICLGDILRNSENSGNLRREKNVESLISRQEFSNEYLIAKIGVATAENGPCKVWD